MQLPAHQETKSTTLVTDFFVRPATFDGINVQSTVETLEAPNLYYDYVEIRLTRTSDSTQAGNEIAAPAAPEKILSIFW